MTALSAGLCSLFGLTFFGAAVAILISPIYLGAYLWVGGSQRRVVGVEVDEKGRPKLVRIAFPLLGTYEKEYLYDRSRCRWVDRATGKFVQAGATISDDAAGYLAVTEADNGLR